MKKQTIKISILVAIAAMAALPWIYPQAYPTCYGDKANINCSLDAN